MTFGSLFSGGGAMDLALQRAGMALRWQCEIDAACLKVLRRHWPTVIRHGDATRLTGEELEHVDCIAGGDPCPHRSRGNQIWGSTAPDLWPDFLRIVSAVRPVWVLREHVVSGDADECWGQLCSIGYDAVILEADSAQVTSQHRPREFLVGVLAGRGVCPSEAFCDAPFSGRDIASLPQPGPVAYCLTARNNRLEPSDNYVLEPGRGVRILAAVERERLQGIPDGWTAGLSEHGRARIAGNAVTVPVVQWIGERIVTADRRARDRATVAAAREEIRRLGPEAVARRVSELSRRGGA